MQIDDLAAGAILVLLTLCVLPLAALFAWAYSTDECDEFCESCHVEKHGGNDERTTDNPTSG